MGVTYGARRFRRRQSRREGRNGGGLMMTDTCSFIDGEVECGCGDKMCRDC